MPTLNHLDIIELITGRRDWRVTGVFGEMAPPRTKPHKGTDYALPSGTVLRTPERSIITYELFGVSRGGLDASIPNWGNYTGLFIPEWDITLQYSHTQYKQSVVNKGEVIGKGLKVTLSGATGLVTGPHLDIMVARGKVTSLAEMLDKAFDFETLVINTDPKAITIVASEVIRGDWGNGKQRVDRLEQAGYDYDEVQAMVNKLLEVQQPQLKDIDTVAREVIRGDWGNGMDRVQRLEHAGYNSSKVQARVNDILG